MKVHEAAFASPRPSPRYDLELLDLGRAIQALCPDVCGIRQRMIALALSQIGDLHEEVDGHPDLEDAVLELARAVGVYCLRAEAYWRADEAKGAKGGAR